ncbi:MAG: biotin carboxylase N-terminal domain-containing protein [Chthonomonadales bacterium]
MNSPSVKTPFRKLLIANRGEIAVRIIRACQELNLPVALAASEADMNSPAARLADEVICVGPGPASESYLRQDKIVAAGREVGADAIHPGYGFLSENADFAEASEEAGITFVGPPSSVIRLLGDKIRAKNLMAESGVPVMPGYTGENQADDHLLLEAENIGMPVLIKASAGGGGRGMRVVREIDQFLPELAEARREAVAAFGDARVLLEKYVERSRHIEVQIFGDSHGNVVHLFERECSIQRRHQKIIEESPSPVLTPEVRQQITSAAVTAGRAAGYQNAGTVEFLFDESLSGDHKFYFLEVNTRLQVEHPVTEMLTGIDLVKLQLKVASGEPIGLEQSQIGATGHALEVRIYAEDPARQFLPSIGDLACWVEPQGPWIRVDSGIKAGGEVSPYYDPMLAKLIVRGENRSDTIHRMISALKQFHVLGVTTNIGYLLDIVSDEVFQSGQISTQFLAERFADWKNPTEPPVEVLIAAALASMERTATPSRGAKSPTKSTDNPWSDASGWRLLAGTKS